MISIMKQYCIPDNYTRLIKQNYYAAVTYVDNLVGQLLQTFDQFTLLSNTIVLLVGDHGKMLVFVWFQ